MYVYALENVRNLLNKDILNNVKVSKVIFVSLKSWDLLQAVYRKKNCEQNLPKLVLYLSCGLCTHTGVCVWTNDKGLHF